MAPKDRYLINSILRACNILKSFSRTKTHFKMSELAVHLGLDRSTTYRILLSLEEAGFVEKDGRTGGYKLGLAAFEIGSAYLTQIDVIQVSKPVMAELASKAQETVHLAVLSDTEIVYVDKVDSPRALGVMSKIGQRGPLHCTALGKALLAFLPEAEKVRIVHGLKMARFHPDDHHVETEAPGGARRRPGSGIRARPAGDRRRRGVHRGPHPEPPRRGDRRPQHLGAPEEDRDPPGEAVLPVTW